MAFSPKKRYINKIMILKKIYLICFIILSISSVYAQTKFAKIVVYRNENTSRKLEEEYKIFADGILTTILKNNLFEEFYMPEGSFKLNVNESFKTTIKVDCIKGATYYFRINQDLESQNNLITISAIDSITAKSDIKFMKKSEVKKTKIYVAQQNRIGLLIEPGLGFNKVEMVTTTTGSSAMLSFGGGGAIGLSYSYLFSDNFGWSVELKDQFSFLTPSVTNASVDFNRGLISTTPYFTFPIIKRLDQNIKIGAGIDYYFNPILAISTEKLTNGFNDKWAYNSTFGYHLIAFFDMKLGRNLRGYTGFRYSDVRYTFASSKSFHPNTVELTTPHGNSLSASFGLEYCF